MRTVTFKSVLWSIAKKAGLTPAVDGLDLPIAAEITESINTAVKLAWEYSDWAELCPVISRTVTRTTETDVGTFCTLSYLDSDGLPFMGAALNVWDANPLANSRAVRIDYTLGPDGIYLPQDCPDIVYLRYRLPHGVYSDEEYTARYYEPGEVVYVPATGECYICRHPIDWITNGRFLATPAGWTLDGWTYAAAGARLALRPSGGAGGNILSRTIAALPAGDYRLAIRVPTVTAGTGSTGLTLFVRADGDELGLIQAATAETIYDFTHEGGDCLIELDAQYEGNGDVTFEIAGIAVRPVQPYDNGRATPAAPGESWALVPFPMILAEAVKHGGLASWRRTEGQDASAMQLENIMSEWLDHELDLICHQQQQGKHWRR